MKSRSYVVEPRALGSMPRQFTGLEVPSGKDAVRSYIGEEPRLVIRLIIRRAKVCLPWFMRVLRYRAGGSPKLALERPVERRLELVADIGRHVEHRLFCGLQLACRQLQAPASQIGQGWLTQKFVEAFKRSGARCPDLGGRARQPTMDDRACGVAAPIPAPTTGSRAPASQPVCSAATPPCTDAASR